MADKSVYEQSVADFIDKLYSKANFGPNDSKIASTVFHPIEAAKRAGNWFTENVNTAAGIPSKYDNADLFVGVNPYSQVQAASNLASLAGTGAMPFNQSGPATLGTFAGMKSETAPRLNRLIAQDMEKAGHNPNDIRSEEHTSELQSH